MTDTVKAPSPTTTSAERGQDAAVLRRLSLLDRFLPVWIGVAMLLGIGLGRAFPGLNDTLDHIKVDTVSLPIALGLLLMMYPVLAKVRYGDLGHVTADRRLLGTSLLLNWVVGPALMFTLAWVFLPDLPEYRTGLIIIGLARCIAMVLIWNDLADGDREAAVVLVALNSLFQIVAYSLLGYFYLKVLPGWLGLDQATIDVSMWQIGRAVLIFLGVPLVAGYLTRRWGEARRGRVWYEEQFLPRIGPVALWGLLFTVVILFALQGSKITHSPFDVARIAVPLVAYFGIMWTGAFVLSMRLRFGYPRSASVAFTAAGNNFELGIAVAISVFGVTSGQALAGVVGPLIEVPALIALVYVSLWARKFYRERTTTPDATSTSTGATR
jgi:ACR3 family arsenite transporter